jgi:hypothetical protein
LEQKDEIIAGMDAQLSKMKNSLEEEITKNAEFEDLIDLLKHNLEE